MRTLWALPFLLSACAFEGSPGQADLGPDDEDDPMGGMPVDVNPTCLPGIVDLCGQVATNSDFVVSSDSFNMDSDTRCKVIEQSVGPDICLLYYNRIEVQAGGTFRAYGGRALAMVAKDTLLIRGTLEVGSRSARVDQPGAGSSGTTAGLCAFTSPPEAADGGGAGGAGGTFLTQGGNGGNGNTDNNPPPGNRLGGVPGPMIIAPDFLRGGCDGQAGAPDENAAAGVGGQGGGAVYLKASALDISGSILAGGAGGTGGGVDDGGGGGGSGGMIVVQSASLKVSGLLLAAGGAGGQGGGRNDPGETGDDATLPMTARGGDTGGRGGNGGNGGTGSGATTNGVAGLAATPGGGGGGGGAGFILLLSSQIDTTESSIVPAATRRSQ